MGGWDDMTYRPKEKILTEGELCKWWNITADQLTKLRLKKDLPYISVSKSVFLFRETALIEWLVKQESLSRIEIF
jgi:hypothetical protein